MNILTKDKGIIVTMEALNVSKTLIIGFGNLLMGDDGAGIHAVRRLASFSLPAQVEVIDGGVNSFAALTEIHNAAKVIFIDAMQGGGQPGDVYCLTLADFEALPSGGEISIHEFSLADTLYLYRQMGEIPPVIIYGIEPANLDWGVKLSPSIGSAVENVVSRVLSEIF